VDRTCPRRRFLAVEYYEDEHDDEGKKSVRVTHKELNISGRELKHVEQTSYDD
jgi:hypothetical protein